MLPFLFCTAFTIVTFGDSTTAPRKNVHIYTEQLQAAFPKVRFVNRGVPSDTTERGEKRFARDVLAEHPDLVVMQFGINDSTVDVIRKPPATTSNVPRAQYESDLKDMIGRIRQTGAVVVLMTPNPMRWTPRMLSLYGHPPYDPAAEEGFDITLEPYVEIVRKVARETDTPLVDVYALFNRLAAHPGQSCASLLIDGMHPNTAGHELITRELTPLIKAALKSPAAVRPGP